MPVPPLSTRRLGRTGLELSALGFGAGPLGELNERLTTPQAAATLAAAWSGGVRYFDTAPYCSHGKSEHRVGAFLREWLRDQFVVGTKVGRVLRPVARGEAFDPTPAAAALASA